MYLYNISILIEENFEKEVIDWLNNDFLKQENNYFQLLEMIDSPHPGTTICLQAQLETNQLVDEIKNNQLLKMQEFFQKNFFEKVFLFDSVMKYLPRI